MDIARPKQILWKIAAGLAGALALSAVYIGIVSWSEGPPPRPLDRHKTKSENGTLWVSVEKFRWQEA